MEWEKVMVMLMDMDKEDLMDHVIRQEEYD